MVLLGQYNRGPLWTSGYAMTETYNLTATVNMVRSLSLPSPLPSLPPPSQTHLLSNALCLMAAVGRLQIRNYLTNQTDWAKTPAQVLTTEPDGIAIMKGEVLSILTNIGSPVGSP